MAQSLVEFFKKARQVSTPLISVTTADPAATMATLVEAFAGNQVKIPFFRWDICKGIAPMNDVASAILKGMFSDPDDLARATSNPADVLGFAEKLPGANPEEKISGAVLFYLNAHRFLENETVTQGIWNLRDQFKENRRTLVLLSPGIRFPPELQQDIISFDEELPSEEELARIVKAQFLAARLDEPSAELVIKAVDATRGLSAFPSEQIVAMSLTKEIEGNLDLSSLWSRKRTQVEQTPGLSVDRGKENYDMIGGLDQVKRFCSGLFKGGRPPKVIVRLEEIEKMMGGMGTTGVGDNTGVSQDQLGVILTAMEDYEWAGFVAVGPPGSGKSLISKATGNQHGVMALTFDLGAMKGSLVGQSEGNIRQAIKIILSIAGPGGAFFIATCNKLDVLPPELRRRFKFGIWFFDLPSPTERESIWGICLTRYGLSLKLKRPADVGWSGADIRNCCEMAWRLGSDLETAASYIVPAVQSDPEGIKKLREKANERFLWASKPGTYSHAEAKGKGKSSDKSGRDIQLAEES